MQDYIVLNGFKSPGACTISGAGSPRGWDERKGYGADGAYLVLVSLGLASFTVTLTFWEDAHWLAWEAFAVLLEKPKGGPLVRALGISHPLLEAPPLRITSAIIEDVGQWEQDDDDELWTCEIKMKAYRPPPKSSALTPGLISKPKASTSAIAIQSPTTYEDAANVEIKKLVADAQKLLPE